MKTPTILFMAWCLGVTSALPAASINTACAPAAIPTASCITTVLTVLATGAVTSTPAVQTPSASARPTDNNGNANTTTGNNAQTFTGTLGGPPPPVISTAGDRPFSVNGNTFVGASAALGRSCDIQHNACANAANSGALDASVGQCDQQNTACKAANNLKRRAAAATTAPLDLGSCSDPTMLFQQGLDGRGYTGAFVAANQAEFNHGSALNVAVIAGFICQRLGSPCSAPADSQATCAQASAAAVAAPQDQRAADAWNAIMGGGGVVSPFGAASSTGAASLPPPAVVTPAPSLAAMPLPAMQLMTFSSCS